jgi:outer membrane protein assembly factor BamD
MLPACAKKDIPEQNFSAEEYYQIANQALNKGQYEKAANNFAKINQEHPYSKLALPAQVMEAYSYYLKHDYSAVIPLLESFIKLHPAYKDIAYVYYIKALAYYEQINDATRDQETTALAKAAANVVIARFPTTKYAQDLKIKLDLINDHLAGKEMEIGRYYLQNGKINAAINRFLTVVEKFQTTKQVQEALYRLTEAYLTLGVTEEARKNAAVLGYNYPNSKWYKRSYDLLKNFKHKTETSK